MSRGVFVNIAALLIAATVVSAPRSGPKPVLDPSQGDGGVSAFYVWDKEVPGTPGQLLRQEPLPESLMLANASKGLRVLYTSTDGIDGKTPIAVSGAVYFPKGPAPPGGWPVIAWGHGTTGVADVCAPSWVPRSQRDTDYLNAWLAQGFSIAATDYQGLGTPGGHPWLVTKAEAYSLIDSARSATSAFRELSKSVVIIGQSQGAHAGLSAALLAPQYAPKFGFRATVATGVPAGPPFTPDMNGPEIAAPLLVTGRGINAGRRAVLSVFRLLALNPTFRPADYLSDRARPAFEAARTGCSVTIDEVASQNGVTAENLFRKTPESAIARVTPFQQYPRPKFGQPVFIGIGLADVTVFPEGQYNFVVAACHEGSTVEAHYYPGKDHNTAVNASLVDSIPFVKKIMAGQPIVSNCSSITPPSSVK